MSIKYTTSSIATPSKNNPNLAFWFESIPSGNPVGIGGSFFNLSVGGFAISVFIQNMSTF
jgi:hypothetical protein